MYFFFWSDYRKCIEELTFSKKQQTTAVLSIASVSDKLESNQGPRSIF